MYSCFVYKTIKLYGYFLQFYYTVIKNLGCPFLLKGSISKCILKDSAVSIDIYHIFV